MKTHTFTTKTTLFCKLLLLLLAALLLVSCNQTVKMPNDKTLRQIELDYGRHMFGEEYDPAVHGEISVSKCYGIYNGCVAAMFSGQWSSIDVYIDVTIGDVVFHYADGDHIEIWHDGEIFTLQEAYDQKLLTKENLQAIAEIQNRWWRDPGVKIPNDKTLRQIELDYGRHVFGEEYDPAVHGKISVLKCYGVYNGCVPVFLSGPWSTTQALKDVTVADVVFHYGTGAEIQVWLNGDFFTLQESYDKKFLTKENLQAIADIHNRVWKELS